MPPLKLLTAGKKPGDLIFDLDLDPYVRSFRHVSTHLLLTEVNEAEVWQALERGRAYVAFDWMADPTGFVYRADRGAENWPIGSEVPFAEGLRLRAEAPLDGTLQARSRRRSGARTERHRASTSPSTSPASTASRSG